MNWNNIWKTCLALLLWPLRAPLLPILTIGVLVTALLADWETGLRISGVLMMLFVLQYATRPPALARDLNLKPLAIGRWIISNDPKTFLAWTYGVIAFFSSLVMLGEIHRGEASLWVWDGCLRSLEQHGIGDAILTFLFYGLFYSVPFVGSRGVLWIIDFLRDQVNLNPKGNTLASLWCGITFFVFFDSIVGLPGAFVRLMPPEVSESWVGVWIAFTVVLSSLWWFVTFGPPENLWRWIEANYSVNQLRHIAGQDDDQSYLSLPRARSLYRRYGEDIWYVCGNLKEACDPNLNPTCRYVDWASEVNSPSRFEEFMVRHALKVVAHQVLESVAPRAS